MPGARPVCRDGTGLGAGSATRRSRQGGRAADSSGTLSTLLLTCTSAVQPASSSASDGRPRASGVMPRCAARNGRQDAPNDMPFFCHAERGRAAAESKHLHQSAGGANEPMMSPVGRFWCSRGILQLAPADRPSLRMTTNRISRPTPDGSMSFPAAPLRRTDAQDDTTSGRPAVSAARTSSHVTLLGGGIDMHKVKAKGAEPEEGSAPDFRAVGRARLAQCFFR